MFRGNPPEGSVKIGPNHYATKEGSIWSSYLGRDLRLARGTNGRLMFGYREHDSAQYKTKFVHVAVCEAFHGPRPEGHDASHRDGNPDNNRPDNLVWETRAESMARRYAHGTDDTGHRNSRSCVSPEDVAWVRENPEGLTHQQRADRLGVSRTTISRIVNNHRYQVGDPDVDL